MIATLLEILAQSTDELGDPVGVDRGRGGLALAGAIARHVRRRRAGRGVERVVQEPGDDHQDDRPRDESAGQERAATDRLRLVVQHATGAAGHERRHLVHQGRRRRAAPAGARPLSDGTGHRLGPLRDAPVCAVARRSGARNTPPRIVGVAYFLTTPKRGSEIILLKYVTGILTGLRTIRVVTSIRIIKSCECML